MLPQTLLARREAAGRNKDRTLKGPVGPGKSVSTELRSSNGNARCVCVLGWDEAWQGTESR